MFDKFMKEVNAEAELHSSTKDDVPTSSQTIAKPIVMRSPLSEYLRFYIGGKVVLNDDMIWILCGVHNTYAVLDGGAYGVIKVTDYTTIKPILRTTQSVTQEEWDDAPKSSLHIGVDGIFYSPELFKYLLSLHIDLFGLIENDLAISAVSIR